VLYLADSSIWIAARRHRATYLTELLAQRLEADEIATCTSVALEVLTGPATAHELNQDWDTTWRHLHWLPVTDEVMERSLDLLLTLADSTAGAHRRRPTDYIVAACAEAAGNDVVLWHWDRDLAAICDYARIPHEPEHERAKEHEINPEPG
jgi:predicted nucleic acid-binding protein